MFDDPYAVRLTPRHSLTLPEAVRRALYLLPGDVVQFHVDGDRVWLRRADDDASEPVAAMLAPVGARRFATATGELPEDVSAWSPPGESAVHDARLDPVPRRRGR